MPEQTSLLPIVTAWLGSDLSYLETLCLTSMVQSGHQTILYCYRDIKNVPNGVELRDAGSILSEKQFIQYSNGSYALGSNIFRYKIFSRHSCIWLDTDMMLLKPIENHSDYVFGWEDERYINTAVLSLPSGSPMLLEIFSLLSQETFFAPWWDEAQIKVQNEAVRRGSALPLSSLPWATIGPKLVTYLAQKHSVSGHAYPSEAFYPVHWRDFRLPFMPGSETDRCLTEGTVGIHFWNHMLGDLKKNPDPESFVARQCKKYEIDVSFR